MGTKESITINDACKEILAGTMTADEAAAIFHGGYGIKHFSPTGDEAGPYLAMVDADERLFPVVDKPAVARPMDYPTGRILDCGCTVYMRVHVMSASLGSSCANCYDNNC